MNTFRKQRLFIAVVFVLGISTAIFLVMLALKENINHYFTPTQIVLQQAPQGKKIRGGGIVVPGSIKRQPGSLITNFIISDGVNSVKVHYNGILPDLFAENSATVVVGYVDENGFFIAKEVLAKHDQYYMPPEVKKAIDAAKNNIPLQTT